MPRLRGFRRPAALFAPALVFAVAVALLARGTRASRERVDGTPAPAEIAIPVVTAPVRRGALVLAIEAGGEVAARRKAVVSALEPGVLEGGPPEVGWPVRRGAIVARVSTSSRAAAVERAEVDVAEARLEYREATFLDEEIANLALRAARAEAVRVRSGLARAETELGAARAALDSATLRAPIDGVVAEVHRAAGEAVAPGQPIVTIVDLGAVAVDVRVPDGDLAGIRVGAEAIVRFPAMTDGARGGEIRGRVVAIAPTVDPASRAGRVVVAFDNPAGLLRPGMYARVAITGRSWSDRLLVSPSAILERDGRHLVFLFEPIAGSAGEGRARWTWVEVEGAGPDGVAVRPSAGPDALPPGSRVLVEGHATLAHDAPVRAAPAP